MRGSMGSFSVIVPIYLGAIFVFFIYIVAKIMIKKIHGTEEAEEDMDIDSAEAYKDDGWWSRITERINKVGECVKTGKDLEIEDSEDEEETKKEEETNDDVSKEKKDEGNSDVGGEKEFAVLKHRLDRTEQSLDNLGKCFH